MRKTKKVNIPQINVLNELEQELTDEKIEKYMTAMSLARNELGVSIPKPDQKRNISYTSIKFYVHPDHREVLNNFCQITGETVSYLIRRLTIEHMKNEIAKHKIN